MSEAARLPLHRRPAFWAGGIFAAFGIISALRMTDAIGSTTGFILMVIAMLQIIPLTRASLAKQRSIGHLSPAIVRYTRRFLLASFGYMLGLGVAVTIANRVDLSEIEVEVQDIPPERWCFALILIPSPSQMRSPVASRLAVGR